MVPGGYWFRTWFIRKTNELQQLPPFSLLCSLGNSFLQFCASWKSIYQFLIIKIDQLIYMKVLFKLQLHNHIRKAFLISSNYYHYYYQASSFRKIWLIFMQRCLGLIHMNINWDYNTVHSYIETAIPNDGPFYIV